MNRALFRSPHAVAFATIVVVYAGIAIAAGSGRGFQLATGWGTLALLVVVMGYVLRKYAHKGGYSPEFNMRTEIAALERADARIAALRRRVLGDRTLTKRDVEREAKKILREEGALRVNRAVVESTQASDGSGERLWSIRIRPREPLGRVARWMHVHLYYGLAFGALLWMHSGNPFDSGLGWLLGGLGYLTFGTGLFGIVQWSLGPTRLTRAEHDLSIEEAHSVAETSARKRRDALEALDPKSRGEFEAVLAAGADRVQVAASALRRLGARSPERAAEMRDLMTLVFQEQAIERELSTLRRVRASFMSWKLVHVPVAIVLSGLVLLHVLAIWKY